MNRSSIISSCAAVVVIYFGATIQFAGAKEPSYDKVEQALAQIVDFKPQVVTLNKLAEMIAKKFDIQVELDLDELKTLALGGESISGEGEDPFAQEDKGEAPFVQADKGEDPFAQDEKDEDGDFFDQEPAEGDDPFKEIGKKEQVDKVNAPGDTQVEIRVTGISLRSFLHFHLQTLDEKLGFVVFPDRILITTKEKRDNKLILRVYDISDLVRSDSQPAEEPDWMADVIQSTVRVTTWRDVGGPASLQDKDGLYSIFQYSESHVRIKELLKTLRQIKARQKKSPGGKSAALGQYPAEQDAREKIFAQLKNKRILLNFHETTLQDVVRQLRKTLGVPVVLDQPTLNEIGVDTHTDVSIKTAKLPAQDALKLMLRKIGPKLTYSIRNEMLVITTSEEAEYDNFIGRIYPVADLVTAKRPSAPGSRLVDYDDLHVLIKKSIDPESWDEAGGWASLGEVEALSSVIIFQSDENHEKIEDLLAKLRDGSIKMPAHQPARRPPAPNGADPIRPAAATSSRADDPEGIEEVHPDERAAVRVVCKKTERGYLDKEDRVVRLWFSGIGVTGAELDRLKEFSQLEDLYFREGSITDAELKHLAGLPSLEYLFFSGPQLTDEGLVHLAGLPQLESLGLHNTKVTDGGLVHLKNLKHLQYLGLFGAGITGEGLTHLKDLPRLARLKLGDSDVTDNGLAALRKNTSLTYLSLSNTKVTDACLPHLATLKQLEALDLDGTKITGASMSHVWNLQQLEVLDVSNTALTDSALAETKRCRSLQYLDLRDTQMTAAGLDHLLELESLETLWLTAEGEITPRGHS